MQKRKNRICTAIVLLVSVLGSDAQTNVQNTGTLFITGAPDIVFVNGSMTNAAAAALINNGKLFVLQNLVNDQSSMSTGAGTLYLNGTAAQSVNGSQTFKTFNLVTNNASGIILNNDLSVSGTHTFTAGIVTASVTPNYLIYESGASYSGDGDSKHVKGWVRKTGTTAFTFPVGNGTAERTIAIANLSALSVFNANYAGITTNTGNIAGPLVTIDPNEYWIVNEQSGGTANINMNWDNSKIAMPPFTLADIRVANYIGGFWTQVGGSAGGNVTTTGTISSNALTSFGAFTFGSISFSLPVNLLAFNAYQNNNAVDVRWTTSDEINVSHYDVQRSDDGTVFYSIGNLTARNVPGIQQYKLTDTKGLQSATYYRLRSVDADGKIKLSQIVYVGGNIAAEKYVSIANPAHGSIHMHMNHLDGLFAYRLNTLTGQTILQGTINVAAPGLYGIQLPPSFKNGFYVLQIVKSGFSFSQKLLIQ